MRDPYQAWENRVLDEGVEEEETEVCPDCAGTGMVLGSTGPTGDDPERPCEQCDMTGRV